MARKNKKSAGAGGPEGFPDKSWNALPEDWRDAAKDKKTEELESDIIKSARSISGLTHDMKNDPKLLTLQEDLKDLKGGYNDTIGVDKAKLEYCIYLLNDRGVPITKDVVKAANKAKKEADSDE